MIGLVGFVLAVCGIISLVYMKKSGHFIKAFIFTAIHGLTALFAVNALGVITGVTLSVNGLTIGSGIIFGTPGIILNLIAEIILA